MLTWFFIASKAYVYKFVYSRSDHFNLHSPLPQGFLILISLKDLWLLRFGEKGIWECAAHVQPPAFTEEAQAAVSLTRGAYLCHTSARLRHTGQCQHLHRKSKFWTRQKSLIACQACFFLYISACMTSPTLLDGTMMALLRPWMMSQTRGAKILFFLLRPYSL